MSRNKKNGPGTHYNSRKNRLYCNYPNHGQRTSVKQQLRHRTSQSIELLRNKSLSELNFFLRKDCLSDRISVEHFMVVFFFKLKFYLYFAIYITYIFIYSMISFLNCCYAHIYLLYCSLFELFELMITLREP